MCGHLDAVGAGAVDIYEGDDAGEGLEVFALYEGEGGVEAWASEGLLYGVDEAERPPGAEHPVPAVAG